MSTEPTARQHSSRAFWDEAAREDVHFKIWNDPRALDPELRDDAFAESGRSIAMRLSHHVHPEARVVDLGCGIGRVMRELAPACREIVGVDVSAAMIERAGSYLESTRNTRLICNDGASLVALDDDSVDFLYSTLCFIHVDKRSAYRYLREIERVLRPGCRAFVQVQDILCDEGLAEFQSVVGNDFPYEFYTQGEVTFLVESVGLVVTKMTRHGALLDVIVQKGRVEDRIRELAATVHLAIVEAEGAFGEERVCGLGAGRLVVRASNEGSEWQNFSACLRVGETRANGESHQCFSASSCVRLAPQSESRVEFGYEGDSQAFAVEVDGAKVEGALVEVSDPPQAERLEFLVELIPNGLSRSAWVAEHLPDFQLHRVLKSDGPGEKGGQPTGA